MAQFAGNAHWAEPSSLFAHGARQTPLKCKNEYIVLALDAPGSSRLYRPGVSQAQNAEESGDERLQWYGHAVRMANYKPPKFVLYWIPENGLGRGPGRPIHIETHYPERPEARQYLRI